MKSNNKEIVDNNKSNEKDEKKSKRWLIILLLLLFMFVVLEVTFSVTGVFDKITNNGIINIVNQNNVSAPLISGGSKEWSKKQIIKVVEDSKTKNGIDYYEYCISDDKNFDDCNWQITYTKNMVSSISGKNYIVFRGVDKKGNKSKLSNIEETWIDNEAPVINNIDFSLDKDKVIVKIDASDNLNDDKENDYYYKLDDGEFIKIENNFEFTITDDKKHSIVIKVVDKLGNVIEVEKEFSKSDITGDSNENDNSDNDSDIDNNENDNNNNSNGDNGNNSKPNDTPNDESGDKEENENPEEEKDNFVPIINLDKLPSEFFFGESYQLPSEYKFGTTGGKVVCKVNDTEVINTVNLNIGNYHIECEAIGNNGITTKVHKDITIKPTEGMDEEFDGWMTLNLYYPENSTDWQWRIGKTDEIRTGYNGTGWQDYTGPILVKIDDINDIYIRYSIDGKTVIKARDSVLVDIEPQYYTLYKGQKTRVKITYDDDALTKEYKIGDGKWQNYTGSFEVGVNTVIEARATKTEFVYDNEGNLIFEKEITGNDSVFISELLDGRLPDKYSSSSGSYSVVSNGTSAGTSDFTISYFGGNNKPSYSLDGPIITLSNTELAHETDVTITTKEEARTIYYSINNGAYQKYESPLHITNNCVIKSYYIRESDGKTSSVTTERIDNLRGYDLPYVKITANPDPLLGGFTYSTDVTITGKDYEKLEYSLDGIYYKTYGGTFKVNKNTTVYARATNINGTTTDVLVINNIVNPVPKDNLNIDIIIPKTTEVVKSVDVSIDYDERATTKLYKIGNKGNWIEYTGSFKVEKNATIYAYATSDNGVGNEKVNIDFLYEGLTDPIIKANPENGNIATSVSVNIEYNKNAITKKYKINNGEYKDYTGSFDVSDNNTIIHAISEDSFGEVSESTYIVTNIVGNPPIILIERDMYYLIKLNYPVISSKDNREYKWKKDGEWKPYKDDGILLIKPQYKDKMIDANNELIVMIEDENGNEIVFNGDWYLLDVSLREVSEHLFMRWDSNPPDSPEIVVSTTDWARSIRVGINYQKGAASKQYKLVYSDGTTSGWLDYTKPFTIDKNNTTIYAKSSDKFDVWSKPTIKLISNIDLIKPRVNYSSLSKATSTSLTVKVDADDSLSGIKKYYLSLDGENYVESNSDTYTFSGLLENSEYEIYVKVEDYTGNVSDVISDSFETTNIGDITFNVSPDNNTWALKKEITINYPGEEIDNYIYQYSLDNGDTWEEYTDKIVLEDDEHSIIARVLTGNKEYLKSHSFRLTKIDHFEPSISLDDLPDELPSNSNYKLPSSYTVNEDKSGGSASCNVNGFVVDNTKKLGGGVQIIECTVTTGAGKSKTISKTVAVEVATLEVESIMKALENEDLGTGLYNFKVQNSEETVIYPVRLYTYYEDQHWTTNQTFGEASDVATASTNAQNMVIVKVNGDVTIDKGVTVGPYYNSYGGPKGFTLYVTGTLTNNGTIDNSHGAKAEGQNVYLWKNADGTYEYVPAVGATGGYRVSGSNGVAGQSGGTATGRQTGGGGSGASSWGGASGAGAAGTSYSGGAGGGGNTDGTASDGSLNGGTGGSASDLYRNGGGAGNPGGYGWVYGSNGTGGLLVIYANNYKNNGVISATGSPGGNGYRGGGSSGGGSINIFTNQSTGIDQLGIITDTRYNEIKGSTSYNGGSSAGSQIKGGTGGSGTINIGSIRKGQYYDLKEVIEQDKEAYIESITIRGDSILSILEKNSLKSGYYYFIANEVNYPVHLYTYNEDQHWTEDKVFGDEKDVATSATYAQNMVIVKVNGDVTIDSGVTVRPYYNSYGGPKGFTLYVTGKLTNNGTIDNSHGAKAEGQDVYLWKNADGTYEYVPALGATGGYRVSGSNGVAGQSGGTATGRQTGGGGSGGTTWSGSSGAGTAGTSYSGGAGGGGNTDGTASDGSLNGGTGGSASDLYRNGGGAGNPGGYGWVYGSNGTGGLLVIYANNYKNNGVISATGLPGGNGYRGGGSSGGGSINIFTNQSTGIDQLGIITNTRYNEIKGSTLNSGGSPVGSQIKGGTGGSGTVNIGSVRKGQYYDLKEIIEQDKEAYIESVTIRGDSILSILEKNDLKSGYYYFIANEVNYPVHLYTYDEDQHFTTNQTFGDANDVATASTYAQNMVIVKVNGDVTIDKGVTVGPYYNSYGGPKGFTLYVTGKLTNNGTIDNSHGAKAEGQDVYLWKNADGTYEYVPATGASGGNRVSNYSGIVGESGTPGTGRQTGGGGSGGSTWGGSSGAGTAGTSYSGGTGGGGNTDNSATDGSINGGAGGSSTNNGSGAGNPSGAGGTRGSDGTGGLLVIYANKYKNNGVISTNGSSGGNGFRGGGSSGGGSINIFTNQSTGIDQLGIITNTRYNEILGTIAKNGGSSVGSQVKGGAGGSGTVNIGSIRKGQYYDLKEIIEQDKELFEQNN